MSNADGETCRQRQVKCDIKVQMAEKGPEQASAEDIKANKDISGTQEARSLPEGCWTTGL